MSRWPLHSTYFWQTAPFFRILLPLAAGIIAYDKGFPEGTCIKPMMVALVLALILLAATGIPKQRSAWMNAAFPLIMPACFAIAGWQIYALSDSRNAANYFSSVPDPAAMHVARIAAEPRAGPNTMRYTVDVLYRLRSETDRVSGKALLYVYKQPTVSLFRQGDTLVLPANWQLIRNSGNPFEFDNVAFQRRNDVYWQQFLSPDQLTVFGPARPGEGSFIQLIHDWCARQLRIYVRDTTTLGLLQAMLLGDERSFDAELREAYSHTGVIHIVSISGSHVAVLFLVVMGLLSWIKTPRGPVIKYVAGLFLVWLYVLVAGAAPSAVRSAVMFSVLALGVLSDREGQSLNTLAGAAFVLLVGKPSWLFTVGFQLSFGAVLSILVFYKPLYQLWPQTNPFARKIWQAVAVSISAEILTAPLVIYYFHNFPLLFIIANLLSSVLIGFCALVGGMAIIAFCWLPPLAQLLGWIVSKLVAAFNSAILFLRGLNPRSFQYLQISGAELVLIYLLISAVAIFWLRRKRQALFVALPSACLLLILLSLDKYAALQQERLIVYNNGRQAAVEMIRGQYCSSLAGANIDNYHVRAARTAWHAWKEFDGFEPLQYFCVAGKKVLVLTDTSVNDYTQPLELDILVVARPLRNIRIGKTLRTLRPRTVVLATRPSFYHLQRWRDSCAQQGVVLHNVAEKGAFIIE